MEKTTKHAGTSSKVKKILISQPKPEDDKSPYFDLCKKNSVSIEFRPFIQVEGVNTKEFRKNRISFLDFTAVIFTSKTGVDHYFRIAKEMKYTIPDTMKYFCMSESIAFYLQKYITYRKRKIFYGKGTFDELLVLVSKHKEENYLLPLSDVTKPEIPRKLKAAKINYTKVTLYKTVNCDLSDLSLKDYDMLVFYSPSGIKSLLDNKPDFKQEHLKIGSFGPTTAKAVKDAGLRLDVQAPSPVAPSMAKALELFLKEQEEN